MFNLQAREPLPEPAPGLKETTDTRQPTWKMDGYWQILIVDKNSGPMANMLTHDKTHTSSMGIDQNKMVNEVQHQTQTLDVS